MSTKFYDFLKTLQYNQQQVESLGSKTVEHNLIPQRSLWQNEGPSSPVKKAIDIAIRETSPSECMKSNGQSKSQKKIQMKITTNDDLSMTNEKKLKAEVSKLQSQLEIQGMLQKHLEEELLVKS